MEISLEKHKYGLCNQLALICNQIHLIHTMNANLNVCFTGIKTNLFKDNNESLSTFLNIEKTNDNLKKYNYSINLFENNKDLKYNEQKETIKNDKNKNKEIIDEKKEIINKQENNEYNDKILKKDIDWNMFPIIDKNIPKLLEPNNYLLSIINNLKPKDKYYCVHFRLDLDSILIHCYNQDLWEKYIQISDPFESKAWVREYIDEDFVQEYIRDLNIKYLQEIHKIGIDNHYYICTPIGRDSRHDQVNNSLDFLLSNLPNKTYHKNVGTEDRELAAFIELNIMKDSEGIIGFLGSTFSQMGEIISGKKTHYIDGSNNRFVFKL